MSEFEKLKNRLQQKFDNGMTNFHISKGEKWNDLTEEERANAINDMLDEVDRWDALSTEEKMRIQIKEVYDSLKQTIKLCQFDTRNIDNEYNNIDELRKRLSNVFCDIDMALCTLGNWVR